jgi:DNA-binding response OmpR family regulator
MNKKVLLIDDDKELSGEMTEILEAEGFTVKVAFDGKQGERLIRKSRYDIILVDFKLPGMTGTDLLKKVKSLILGSRIFVISGRPFMEKFIKEEGLSKIVNGIVTKPFVVRKFLDKIRAPQ